MPRREYRIEEWRRIRTIGTGVQGEAVLMQRLSDGILAVRKQGENYVLSDSGLPVQAVILQGILPSSRRIIKLMSFSFKTSRRRRDLIEWYEYCRGGDLQHAVERFGRLSEDFIWHCFTQIAEALDVVHNCGSQRVIHQDVKPDNIFLEQKYLHEAPWPSLKLGDFGASSLRARTNELCMPRWNGPELPHQSAASDMWALGAIIHWLVHRRPPIAPRPANYRGSQADWEKEPRARKPSKTFFLNFLVPFRSIYSQIVVHYSDWCLQ